MCGGLKYTHAHPETGEIIERKVFFPIPHAEIPILDEGASSPSLRERAGVRGVLKTRLVQWGRRKGEDEEYDVPQTGWARLQSLAEGRWNRYSPRRVKIPALCWMEKDSARESHWFDMAPDTCLLGVDIKKGGKEFVYIVTKPAPPEFAHIHDRIPLIVETASCAFLPQGN